MSASNLMIAAAVPSAVAQRGINASQWSTLCNSLFPGARPESVLLAIDYCRSRNLDPLKKPCHIVPIEVKVAGTDRYEWRDVVMSGIYEYRITAHRTGQYLGHTEPEYGPPATFADVDAPEWCALTVFRWNEAARERVPFPVKVFFREAVTTKRDGKANQRWARAPMQMLTKCTEAAALREAFPEEFGGEATMEEMEGRTIDVDGVVGDSPPPAMPKRKTASEPTPAARETTAPVAETKGPVAETKAPAAEPTAPAALHVAHVHTREHQGAPYYVIELSSGHKLSTRDDAVATAADALVSRRVPIVLRTADQAAADPGADGVAILVYTPPPDKTRTPRLDRVIA